MVYHTLVVACKPRNLQNTSQLMKQIALTVFNGSGVIRRFSNEGVIRPYRKFRDINAEPMHYVRYLSLSCDVSPAILEELSQQLRDHPDVVHHDVAQNEKSLGYSHTEDFFPLDLFSRPEEEINWPPQANADAYEQLEMNWKEFSRTRWSDYLRQ